MDALQFDTGVRTYTVNGKGTMRFNPGDPNVYARFMEAAEKFAELESGLTEKAQGEGQDGENPLKLLAEADEKAKEILSWVFGQDNDFDEIFDGVSLMAAGYNGKRVIENFMEALEPVIKGGIEQCVKAQTQEAVQAAKERRSSQG